MKKWIESDINSIKACSYHWTLTVTVNRDQPILQRNYYFKVRFFVLLCDIFDKTWVLSDCAVRGFASTGNHSEYLSKYLSLSENCLYFFCHFIPLLSFKHGLHHFSHTLFCFHVREGFLVFASGPVLLSEKPLLLHLDVSLLVTWYDHFGWWSFVALGIISFKMDESGVVIVFYVTTLCSGNCFMANKAHWSRISLG